MTSKKHGEHRPPVRVFVREGCEIDIGLLTTITNTLNASSVVLGVMPKGMTHEALAELITQPQPEQPRPQPAPLARPEATPPQPRAEQNISAATQRRRERTANAANQQ